MLKLAKITSWVREYIVFEFLFFSKIYCQWLFLHRTVKSSSSKRGISFIVGSVYMKCGIVYLEWDENYFCVVKTFCIVLQAWNFKLLVTS